MNYADEPAAPPSGGFSIAGRRIDWGAREVGFGALWFLTLFLLLPVPLALPFLLAYGDDAKQFYAVSLAATLLSQAGLVVVAAHFSFRKYGGSWERLGFRQPSWATLGWAGAAFAGALVVALAYGAVIALFDIDYLKGECDDQLPVRILNDPWMYALAGVAVVGFAPVCEEVFFRGFAFPGFARSWGVAAGVVASSLLWSTLHLGPALPKTIVPIFLIGIVFALTYIKSGNILSTIGAHLAYNVIGYIALAGCDP